jgi:hypothetical protein
MDLPEPPLDPFLPDPKTSWWEYLPRVLEAFLGGLDGLLDLILFKAGKAIGVFLLFALVAWTGYFLVWAWRASHFR